jgi:hypothetical protein
MFQPHVIRSHNVITWRLFLDIPTIEEAGARSTCSCSLSKQRHDAPYDTRGTKVTAPHRVPERRRRYAHPWVQTFQRVA